MWCVGQKVVCVNGRGWFNKAGYGQPVSGPNYGDVLTIRWYGMDAEDLIPVLAFYEWPGGTDENFDERCFVPLDELSQQVEHIEKEGNELVRELEAQPA
jgi:hypothetical protein